MQSEASAFARVRFGQNDLRFHASARDHGRISARSHAEPYENFTYGFAAV
jgi:hypothetical protein